MPIVFVDERRSTAAKLLPVQGDADRYGADEIDDWRAALDLRLVGDRRRFVNCKVDLPPAAGLDDGAEAALSRWGSKRGLGWGLG